MNITQSKYDIIGDVHGYATPLRQLLDQLGYSQDENADWHHDEGRQLIFVGDLIDRGPEQKDTLHLVRSLVESDMAKCILGNHEYSILRLHIERSNGKGPVQSLADSRNQHKAFFDQLTKEEIDDILPFLFSLPIYLDLPEFRVVHAYYSQDYIDYLTENHVLTPEGRFKNEAVFTLVAHQNGPTDLKERLEALIKGPVVRFPEPFRDHVDEPRKRCRIKWWLNTDDVRDMIDFSDKKNPGLRYKYSADEIDTSFLPSPIRYSDDKPLFFGHYWMRAAVPHVISSKLACTDFSVSSEDKLAAYRFQGESELNSDHFQWVDVHPRTNPLTISPQ